MSVWNREDRGRITIVEVVVVLFSLAVVRALYPVLNHALEVSLDSLSVGETYLFRLLLPFMLLVLLATLYTTAGQANP